MSISITAGLLLAVASATAETAYYRVELSPSGSLVSIGAPVVRGTTILIHGYPDGTLMSLRKSDVRSVSAITAQEAATPAKKSVVAIGNLAMQGGPQAPATSGRPSAAAARAPAEGPRVVATSSGLSVTTDPQKPGVAERRPKDGVRRVEASSPGSFVAALLRMTRDGAVARSARQMWIACP